LSFSVVSLLCVLLIILYKVLCDATTALGWAALALSVLAAVAGAVLAFTKPTSKLSFYGIVAVVGLDLVLIAVNGHHLH